MSRFQSIFPLARVKFSSLGPLKPFYHVSSSWRIFSFWCKHLKSLQSILYLHTVTCTVTTSYSTTSIDPVLTNLISDIFQIKKFFRVSCVVGRSGEFWNILLLFKCCSNLLHHPNTFRIHTYWLRERGTDVIIAKEAMEQTPFSFLEALVDQKKRNLTAAESMVTKTLEMYITSKNYCSRSEARCSSQMIWGYQFSARMDHKYT